MADAQRNVSIILSVLPGDMSSVKAALKELQELRGVTDEIGVSTNKVTEATKSLAQADKEALEQKRKLLDGKQDEVRVEERASNQKIDLKRREAEEEIRIERETARQVDEIRRPLREPRSVRPLREPDGTVPGLIGGPRAGGSGTTDLSEISAAIEAKMDADFKAFEENEKRKTDAARQEAEKRAADADQATQNMPKHWRNVGLNAGQAAASAARFVGHMRMLKNIGGEGLEDVAKKFMTIQSRVEMIAASTSLWTNIGTMADGLKTAGKDMQLIVDQQLAMGRSTTMMQSATLGLGKAAQSILPYIAPIQFVFTAITTAVVLADIAMDAFTESTEEQEEKARKYLDLYNTELDKIAKKLNAETELMSAQTSALHEQWEIRKLMAGDEGLDPGQVKEMQQQERAANDAKVQKEMDEAAHNILGEGITKKEREKAGQLEAEKRKLEHEIKWLTELKASDPELYAFEHFGELPTKKHRLAQIPNEQREFATKIGQDEIDLLRKTQIEDGRIKDLNAFMNQIGKLPDTMEDQKKKLLAFAESKLVESSVKAREDFSEAKGIMDNAEMERKKREAEIEDLQEKQLDEKAFADRFKTFEGKFAVEDARRSLADAEKATNIDDKASSVENAQVVLERAGMMTPELSKILKRGASADIEGAKREISDAEEYTPAEERDAKKLIEDAEAAIIKAENERDAMGSMLASLTALLGENAKHLEEVRRAIENRDLN